MSDIREQVHHYYAEHGPTLHADLAKQLNVSRERIRQIVKDDNKLFRVYDQWFRNKAQAKLDEHRMKQRGTKTAPSELFSDPLVLRQLSILTNKKSNAKKKSYEFSLLYGDLEWPNHCPVLGIELDYFSTPYKKENSPSFDRVDSNKGYVKGNVRIISWRANRIKNDGTAEEHEKIVKYIRSIECQE